MSDSERIETLERAVKAHEKIIAHLMKENMDTLKQIETLAENDLKLADVMKASYGRQPVKGIGPIGRTSPYTT